MVSLSLKDVPEALADQLRQRAARTPARCRAS
jgi:hypothetical protein